MAIVTTVTSVSARYYEKRNRMVAELNIKEMCRALGEPIPEGLSDLSKPEVVKLALSLHQKFPE
jgi:hypothetical protein